MSSEGEKLNQDLSPVYKAKHLRKINSMRMTNSQPDIHIVPTLTKGQVLFVTAASRNGEPSSCYNCWKYNAKDASCSVLPASITVKKFIDGDEYKRIEYWPVCGVHECGRPNNGTPIRRAENDPDYVDLVWINAPKVGQPCGGANCGGSNGGDDCDYWQVRPGEDDKREVRVAFCRVLQTPTANGDCCSAWEDDDVVDWQKAQSVLKS